MTDTEPKSWGGAMWREANKRRDSREKTYRKAFTPNALVPKLTRKTLKESDRLDYATILDFGCGKDMLIPNKWREEKIWCDGHDLSLPNKKPRLDSYDVIMVSNVLNVQETNEQLEETINEILSFCHDGTQIYGRTGLTIRAEQKKNNASLPPLKKIKNPLTRSKKLI
jgi:hypothetical protein